jgi:hypothetical protein
MDPINKVPTGSVALFEQFSRVAHGYPADNVMDAALNVIVNVLRQTHDTRDKAGLSYDEFTTKAKSHLMECYDSTGRKKGVYPYHQIIRVPFSDLRDT